MRVSYEGIGQLCATFGCAEKMTEGTVVKVSGSGEVASCAEEDEFFGVVRSVSGDGEACSVQLGGFVTVKFSGTIPMLGYCELCADGDGGIMACENGARRYLVAAVEGTNATIML